MYYQEPLAPPPPELPPPPENPPPPPPPQPPPPQPPPPQPPPPQPPPPQPPPPIQVWRCGSRALTRVKISAPNRTIMTIPVPTGAFVGRFGSGAPPMAAINASTPARTAPSRSPARRRGAISFW